MTKLVASLGSLEWIDGKAQKAGIFLDDKKKFYILIRASNRKLKIGAFLHTYITRKLENSRRIKLNLHLSSLHPCISNSLWVREPNVLLDRA